MLPLQSALAECPQEGIDLDSHSDVAGEVATFDLSLL